MKKKHEPVSRRLPNHPSGRPVRKYERKGQSQWRVPDSGPVTPRLKTSTLTPAIGFLAARLDYDDE